jgi:hypothetical protein
MARPARVIGVAVALAFGILLIDVGILYEQLGRARDARRFPQVGRSVDIGGRSLNIYCSGQGTPAVIFDSGGGAFWLGHRLRGRDGCAEMGERQVAAG